MTRIARKICSEWLTTPFRSERRTSARKCEAAELLYSAASCSYPPLVSGIFTVGVTEETEPNAAIPLKNGRTWPIRPNHGNSEMSLAAFAAAI
jgi:hypothetical protein